MSTTAQGRVTDFIQFSAVMDTPTLAQSVANSVANHFVERSKRAQSSSGKSAIKFLEDQKETYHDLLQKCEDELEKYRKEHYDDLPNVKEGVRSRLLQLSIEKDTRQLQLNSAKSQLAEAKKQLEKVPQTIRTDVIKGQNPVRVDLQNSLSQMQRNLQLLLTDHTEDHPDVKRLREQIASVQEQLKKEPDRVDTSETQVINPQYQELLKNVSTLEQEISGDEAALRQLVAAENANTGQLDSISKEEKHYNDLLRNQKQYSQLYNQVPGASARTPSAAPPCRTRNSPSRSNSTPPH